MSNRELSGARAFALAACLLLGATPLPAVTPQSPAAQPDILVLINPLRQGGEGFATLMADAARYKLGARGLAAQVVSATPSEADAPLPRAQASGASAALVCRYQVEGRLMEFTLGWYDVQQTGPAVVVQASGPMDLHLDGVILTALDEILDKVQDRVAALSARRAAEQAASPAPAAAAPAGLTLPGRPAPGGPEMPAPSAASLRRLLLSGGFAPFVPTGAASYYFQLGYLPSLLASLFIDTPVGPLGIGVYAGMDYFAATGVLDSADNYLLPIGLDLRYELGRGNLRPFFHISGGPAVLIMITGTQGTLIDVLPFLKSGVGLEMDFAAWMGVNALLDYDVYFEMPYLLTGFSPSLNMVFRP